MSKSIGKIKAANLRTSERLKAVLKFMSDGKEHSTREISRGCEVEAVNTVISELRDNGCRISGRWIHRRFYYRLERRA